MAGESALRWYVSLGVLLLGLVVIWVQPIREFVLDYVSLQDWIPSVPTLGPSPVVVDQARDITYIGSRAPGVEHFQNIFYGQDTSGVNRFAPPVPVAHAAGSVVDATQPGAWCPQGTGDILPFTSVITNVSENCLSLRVARPEGTTHDAGLPVMVWMHGGGHILGSAYEQLYEPDGIVKQAAADGRPLIYVAINYRLGFFGFAKSRALDDSKHTNVGLRDQRAAFEWVRDNIASFGGDPERVTAVGQSVGASDIGLQMVAFGGDDGAPFQQAIMMSGAPGLSFNFRSDIVAKNTAAVAEAAGCIRNGDSQSAETLQCLRDAPAELLTNLSVSAARAAHPPFGELFFYPTYDGDFLPDRPTQLVRAGRIARGIPVIASWVTNDGAWYAPPTTATDDEVLGTFGGWLTGLSGPTRSRLLELYPVEDFADMVRPGIDDVPGPSGAPQGLSPQYYRAAQMNRDLWFTCPALDFAWQYVRHGGVAASQVRLYEHNATRYTPVFASMGVPMWRVAHLSDIPYVLNNRHLRGGADNSAQQLELARLVTRSIAMYVTSGVPDQVLDGVHSWPPAFADATQSELENEFPGRISLQLFGGTDRSTPVTIFRDDDNTPKTRAEQALIWEKLFHRCEFINSRKVREETGV